MLQLGSYERFHPDRLLLEINDSMQYARNFT